LAALQDAFVDRNETRDPSDYDWPVVELAGESYVNSQNKRVFKPLLDVVDWVKPPAAFRLPKPPPSSVQLRDIATDKPPFDDQIPF
jgi:hypothetical protein